MRNIANVVHDLEAVVTNHKIQLEMLFQEQLSDEDRQKMVDSIYYDAELLVAYMDSLKAEAVANGLKKA